MTEAIRTFVVATTLAFAVPAFSHQQSQTPSPEMRQKMAQMHEQMATCLKSDRDMKECQQEMMKSCPMMKDGNCHMMGMMSKGMVEGGHCGMMDKKKSAKTEN